MQFASARKLLSHHRDLHSFFIRVMTARQVSLMVYLPTYNLGCLDKSAALKMNGHKIACNLNIYDLHFISITVTKKGF